MWGWQKIFECWMPAACWVSLVSVHVSVDRCWTCRLKVGRPTGQQANISLSWAVGKRFSRVAACKPLFSPKRKIIYYSNTISFIYIFIVFRNFIFFFYFKLLFLSIIIINRGLTDAPIHSELLYKTIFMQNSAFSISFVQKWNR